MKTAASIEDLRGEARRRLPRALFDCIDGGSMSETTMEANCRELSAIHFEQRTLVDVSRRQTATTIAGQAASMPLAVAPTGLTGLMHPRGEIRMAEAAASFGIPFCLSTMSIHSLEEVRAAVNAPVWFQLYVMHDRGVTQSLVERANAAGCPVLILTVDVPVTGPRRRDMRNGLTVPPRITPATFLDFARRPVWTARMMSSSHMFGNLTPYAAAGSNMTSLGRWIAEQLDPSLSWRDVEWLRKLWPGRLILKGILSASDAKAAAAAGADAIVVSNHGGRQLDGAPSSISVLPEVVDAVGSQLEVLFDGGIRSGQDIVRACALGAKACLSGRALLYAISARGKAGVTTALEILKMELNATMAMTGVTDIRSVDATVLSKRV